MSCGILLAVTLAVVPARLWALEASPSNDGGCYNRDRDHCCLHMDQRVDYLGQYCIPSAAGETFTSGRSCEPECWVQGSCGDGVKQEGHVIGSCAWNNDQDLSQVAKSSSASLTSSPTTSIAQSSTAMPVWNVTAAPLVEHSAPSLSSKDTVIVGAVGGSLGAVALLGGLLGGLMTTTAAPEVAPALSAARFLEDRNPARAVHATVAHKLGSIQPWQWAALASYVLSAAMCMLVGISWTSGRKRPGARGRFAMHEKLADGAPEVENFEADETEGSNSPQSTPDTFGLVDRNPSGVIAPKGPEAAARTVRTSVAAPVYVRRQLGSPPRTPMSGVPHTPESSVARTLTPLSRSPTAPLSISP